MPAAEQDPREAGLSGSLRHLGSTALELVRIRIELLVVEWREEQERGKQLVVLALVAAIALLLALLFVSILIVVLCWDSHRLVAIGGLALLYLGIGGACLWRLRRSLGKRTRPFDASLRELAEDLAALRPARPDEDRS